MIFYATVLSRQKITQMLSSTAAWRTFLPMCDFYKPIKFLPILDKLFIKIK